MRYVCIFLLPACQLLSEKELKDRLGTGDSETDTAVAADSGADADSGEDTDIDTASLDDDGDGYTPETGDCNDADATVNPASAESCATSADDNCDGEANEVGATDCTAYYVDADGDGYGDATAQRCECTASAGDVANGDDCNDTLPTVHPAASEVCNGTDDDCDGVVDEPDASDASIWHADGDADGYGSTTEVLTACEQPDGYVADDLDCDDADNAVHPAAVEVCDGMDDDCNGLTDDDPVDSVLWYAAADADGYGDSAVSVGGCSQPVGFVANNDDCDDSDAALGTVTTWYYDGDGDGYGDSATSITYCRAPAGYLADGTDCDDADDAVSPGGDEVWASGVDEDCDGVVDEDDAITGAWVGTVDMTYVYDGSYCAGTYTCAGSASATGYSDGTGGIVLSGTYSCTPVSSGGYTYGYCTTTTWAPSGTFEVDSMGGAYFSGELEAGSCVPYGFPYVTGELSTSATVSASGLFFGFAGRACPAGDASTVRGEMTLTR